jgi:hypothetical protein
MRSISALADDFVRQLRTNGPRHTLWLTGAHIGSLIWSAVEDWRLGISTSREVWGQELGMHDQRNHAYVATDYRTFEHAIRHVQVRPKEDVFVDFGSGKGRIVMRAAMHPFRRVIGVELSPQLHAVATRNLAAVRRRQCDDVQLVVADATRWQVPSDASVLFFFNPFEGEILARVFDNIRQSFLRTPRAIRIIYVRPERFFERQIAWRQWLTRTAQMPCREGTVGVYETTEMPAQALRRT